MRTLLNGLDIPPRATAMPAPPGYRSAAPPDRVTRTLVYAACGLGGLLAVGLVGWMAMGRGTPPTPVIEADSRPVRVKPDSPGGMVVAGADEGVAGPQRMAPVAETPAPQALRAQQTPPSHLAAHPAARAAPAVAALPAPSAPAATAVPANGPTVVPTSVPTSVPAVMSTNGPTSAPAVAPASVPVGVGRVVVQLAALDTEALGRTEWDRLSKKMPTLLAARAPILLRADVAGHTVWRVRTGGFADTAEATAFCTKVKARGGSCSLAF